MTIACWLLSGFLIAFLYPQIYFDLWLQLLGLNRITYTEGGVGGFHRDLVSEEISAAIFDIEGQNDVLKYLQTVPKHAKIVENGGQRVLIR